MNDAMQSVHSLLIEPTNRIKGNPYNNHTVKITKQLKKGQL